MSVVVVDTSSWISYFSVKGFSAKGLEAGKEQQTLNEVKAEKDDHEVTPELMPNTAIATAIAKAYISGSPSISRVTTLAIALGAWAGSSMTHWPSFPEIVKGLSVPRIVARSGWFFSVLMTS